MSALATVPATEESRPAAETAWVPPTWEEVVTNHSAKVYRLAYRLTGNKYDAEDLTQEVFVRVFRSLDSYTPGTFEGWLHRITTNLFLDQARRKQRIRFDPLSDERASSAARKLPEAESRRSSALRARSSRSMTRSGVTSTSTCSAPAWATAPGTGARVKAFISTRSPG